MMNFLSIDPGVPNFAMVGATVYTEKYREQVLLREEITLCVKIDLTALVDDCYCPLNHEKLVCDYISHLIVKYQTYFDKCDKIIMERQLPHGGVVSVQELIMQLYRDKCYLVSTGSLHVFLGIRHMDYEERKAANVKFAMDYLSGEKEFMFHERKHDMADALCFLYYYLSRHRKSAPRTTDVAFTAHIQKYMYKDGNGGGKN